MPGRGRPWIAMAAAVLAAFAAGAIIHPSGSARSATVGPSLVRGTDFGGTKSKASLAGCAPGRRVLGGGYDISGPDAKTVRVTRNFPYKTAQGDDIWAVGAVSDTGATNWRVVAWAVCT